ncbi:hypothetical protein ACH4OW_17125 [Streptomyces sp. NPDC017056]|uniref:hypothetical protein n=1 Tax=Streptomyces sp. NPDC017056 TaxID=3364973 RepID=UPI0037B56920
MCDATDAHVLPVQRLGGWVLKPAPSRTPTTPTAMSTAYCLEGGGRYVRLEYSADLLVGLVLELARVRTALWPPPGALPRRR